MNHSISGSMFFMNEFQESKQQVPNHFRAGVLCSSPSRFSIEHFVSTDKSNGKYHHGMRISSKTHSKDTSISSRRSLSEYIIWRSWDDCLWFQQTLEDEYERAAREKKTRLAQGKGVKGFNGLYKKDLASSWDSLPSGPNPKSVAQDIHEYLPTLTRRGMLFRASQATIEQRQAELISFIEALFSDDNPTLIKEIRASRITSDFFGYLRKDFEFAEASETSKTIPPSTLTNNLFSYFSASHPSLPSSDAIPPSKPSKRSQRSITSRPLSLTSLNEISEEPRYSSDSPRRSRSRPLSSSSDSSVRSGSSCDTSLSSSTCPSSTCPSIMDNVPFVFGHNPSNPGDPSSSTLEVLPEEPEILSKSPEPYRQAQPRPRASATDRKAHRSYSFFGLSSLRGSLPSSEKLDVRSARESWQTVDSQDSTANDLLDGLGIVLPHSIKEQKFRASIASISTFMTTDSADAVMPQMPRAETTSQPCPYKSSIRVLPLSDVTDDNYSVSDSFHCSISSIPERVELQPGTPEAVGDLSLPPSPSSARTAFNRAPSSMYSALSSSTFSTATTSSSFSADSISVKAIHNTSIILLRVSQRIGLAEVRQRLYDKFTCQEGIPLSKEYSIAFVPPTSKSARAICSTSVNNGTVVQLITLESEWKQLLSTLQGNKITLRIQDVPA